jgi:beta-lactamase superfamily II metal-dependent hydrolase
VLSLEMLPAAQGDALLIQWGTRREPHHMLVDAGPLGTYPAVHDRIADLGANPDLELLVVTHIDGDHIEGVIRLLQDRHALGLRIGDVWFNGWPQLPRTDRQGPDYGEMVGALIQRGALPWNTPYGDNAVAIPEQGPLPSYLLDGDARVTLLGPGPPQLRNLRANWTKVLADVDVTPGQADEALKRLAKRKDLKGLDLQGRTAKLDNSASNGSSICMLFEYENSSLLLTGDSHSEPLVAGIQRLLRERGTDRLRVDALKLPHHCSQANVTDELLALVETPRYLVSTNGGRYRHPDKEAVLRVVGQRERDSETELVFNYLSKTTEPWAKVATAKKYRYTPIFPEGGRAGIVVEV